MAQSYSGRWKATAYLDPPRERFTLDAGHGVTDAPDAQAFTYNAPPLPEVADVGEFPGMEVYAAYPGVTLDMTPVSHEAPNQPARPDEAGMMADSHAAHAQDFGASRGRSFVPGPMDFHGDAQVHTIVAGYGAEATAMNPVALQRGLNADPVNNPDGFRTGETHFWRQDRKFAVGERRHDHRPTTLNTPAFPSNVPPPSEQDFTPYSSPFGSLARPITRMWNRPQLRRDPTGISEAVVSDGAADSVPVGAEWVL